MNTCVKDTKVVETLYPSADYVEEYDTYGTRVFKTLTSTHSPGMKITRVVLCDACKVKKARPQPVEERLRTLQRQEDIRSEADWTIVQKGISRKLGLTGIAFKAVCGNCGKTEKVRDATGRSPLCEVCYKEYRRNYMRDFMRQKRESTHVD